MPDASDQCTPQEILALTGAKAVYRLHGREDAVDLLRVSEQSRFQLRLALLFALCYALVLLWPLKGISGARAAAAPQLQQQLPPAAAPKAAAPEL
jgi:hypothetical protein